MKRIDFKEKSSAFIIGRGLIIAVILFASSLGFILGYFVGKSTLKENPGIKPLQENLKNALPLEAQSQQESQSRAVTSSVEEGFQTEIEAKKEATRDPQQHQKPAKIVYTVQVGAFKDAPDAEALKTKLDKKGFKTCVTPSESKKEGRLYKVWIGEFDTRKEAEALSTKIKKTEGLQAFVTFKKEEESIR